MKPKWIAILRWAKRLLFVAVLSALLGSSRPVFFGGLSIIIMLLFWRNAWAGPKLVLDSPPRRPYRFRNPNAGRWLAAPVAELDKSTVGKLLASRASRDPGVHVVPGTTPPVERLDSLYDPEIDG